MRKLVPLFLLLTLGCGGTDDGPSAPALCESFLDTFCSKAQSCVGGTTTDCLAWVRRTIDCSKARAVRDSYETCLTDIRSGSCGLFTLTAGVISSVNFSASCKGVILTD